MNEMTLPMSFCDAWCAERGALIADAAAITEVRTDGQLEDAGAVQTAISKAIKKLEAARKSVTAPLDDAKKSIMAQEKRLARPLTEQLERLKQMTSAYATEVAARIAAERSEQERREQEAAEAAAAQAEADPFGFNGGGEQAEPPAFVPTPIVTRMPHTSSNRIVERWDYEITDAARVPRELMSVDERKVRAFLAARKADGYRAEQVQVDGLRIFATMQVQGR